MQVPIVAKDVLITASGVLDPLNAASRRTLQSETDITIQSTHASQNTGEITATEPQIVSSTNTHELSLKNNGLIIGATLAILVVIII